LNSKIKNKRKALFYNLFYIFVLNTIFILLVISFPNGLEQSWLILFILLVLISLMGFFSLFILHHFELESNKQVVIIAIIVISAVISLILVFGLGKIFGISEREISIFMILPIYSPFLILIIIRCLFYYYYKRRK